MGAFFAGACLLMAGTWLSIDGARLVGDRVLAGGRPAPLVRLFESPRAVPGLRIAGFLLVQLPGLILCGPGFSLIPQWLQGRFS